MSLEGWNDADIAQAIGTTIQVVRAAIDSELRPVWQASEAMKFGEFIARLKKMEKELWKRYRESSDRRDLLPILGILDKYERAFDFGSSKIKVEHEYRVAGRDQAEVVDEFIEGLVKTCDAIMQAREAASLMLSSQERDDDTMPLHRRSTVTVE